MKTTQELEQRIRGGRDPALLAGEDFSAPTLPDYLRRLLNERGMTAAEAIKRCNLDRSYGYQLFNGTRRPPRDTLLNLALQLGLSEAETQRLLKLAGRPALYARNRRDAAVLYALSHGLSPAETEELLRGLEVAALARSI